MTADNSTTKVKVVSKTLLFFFLAGLCEIGGGYLVWLWIREKKKLALGILGGIVLFVYGIIPTLQPADFGRVYATYGGIFIVSSIVWGRIVEKKKPDRYEIRAHSSQLQTQQSFSTLRDKGSRISTRLTRFDPFGNP